MKEKITFWILFGILIVVTLLYPGDVPWINDGPKLIYNAYISNLHNTFPTSGLIGSLGIPYGPLPVWIYKFLLLISKNLILIVLLKASATLIIVFLSLYFIVKTLNLPIYVMLIPFISPYLYFYARSIWDNCFLIPVSAIFLLTLIKFINTHRLFWFVISFCAIFCLIHIHLMSLLIIIPFFIYLIIFEGKWLLEHWQKAAIVFSIFLCSLLPYLIIILTKSVHVLIVPEICTWHNWMSPMTFFSFWGFDNYFVPEMLTKDYIIPKGLYLF